MHLRNHFLHCTVFCLFLITGACSKTNQTTKSHYIDGQKAMDRVKKILAIGPRPSGSTGARKSAEFIAEEAKKAGAQNVTIDSWREETGNGPLTFNNIYAEIPGKTEEFIILASHFDTKKLPEIPTFNGANDSGSSTGLLLEIIHVLASNPIPNLPTVRVYFFDGEESVQSYTENDGLHGSKRAARILKENKEIYNCRAMILLDMIGDKNLNITISPDTDPTLTRLLFTTARKEGVSDHFTMFKQGSILDDHVPFQQLGVPCINIIDFDYGPDNSWWHTEEDTIDKISPESLEITGNVVIRMLMTLAQ